MKTAVFAAALSATVLVASATAADAANPANVIADYQAMTAAQSALRADDSAVDAAWRTLWNDLRLRASAAQIAADRAALAAAEAAYGTDSAAARTDKTTFNADLSAALSLAAAPLSADTTALRAGQVALGNAVAVFNRDLRSGGTAATLSVDLIAVEAAQATFQTAMTQYAADYSAATGGLPPQGGEHAQRLMALADSMDPFVTAAKYTALTADGTALSNAVRALRAAANAYGQDWSNGSLANLAADLAAISSAQAALQATEMQLATDAATATWTIPAGRWKGPGYWGGGFGAFGRLAHH